MHTAQEDAHDGCAESAQAISAFIGRMAKDASHLQWFIAHTLRHVLAEAGVWVFLWSDKFKIWNMQTKLSYSIKALIFLHGMKSA